MKWTESNIGDLTGKVVIVTGGNSGLGYESCKLYCKYGATVVLASRSITRGNKAISRIKQENPSSIIELIELDLGNINSIENFVETFKNKYNKLDILLNNAGIMTPPYQSTTDGFESQIGVNFLGHFYLTGMLFPIIKTTQNARVVNISSLAHMFGKIDLDSFEYKEGSSYNKMKAYAQSKIANLLFTNELSRRVANQNLDTIVVSAHPGVSKTNLGRHMKSLTIYSLASQNQYMGALPGIRASVDSQAKSNDYYGPRSFIGMRGYPKKRKSNKLSKDPVIAKNLWKYSEELLEFTFNI